MVSHPANQNTRMAATSPDQPIALHHCRDVTQSFSPSKGGGRQLELRKFECFFTSSSSISSQIINVSEAHGSEYLLLHGGVKESSPEGKW